LSYVADLALSPLPVRGAFLLTTYQLQASPFITGDTYEEWKKETRLDVRTGSRTEDNGAQIGPRRKNCQEAKTV
jgi:hypothetical protein